MAVGHVSRKSDRGRVTINVQRDISKGGLTDRINGQRIAWICGTNLYLQTARVLVRREVELFKAAAQREPIAAGRIQRRRQRPAGCLRVQHDARHRAEADWLKIGESEPLSIEGDFSRLRARGRIRSGLVGTIVEDQRVVASRATVENAGKRAASFDGQCVIVVGRAGQVRRVFERQRDVAIAHLTRIGARQGPIGVRYRIEDDLIPPPAPVEGHGWRIDPGEGSGVNRQRVFARAAENRDGADFVEVAKGEHRAAIGPIDQLHTLDRDRLGVDLLSRLHHLHQDIVIDRMLRRIRSQVQRQNIGVEQKSGLKRVEDQSILHSLRHARARPRGARPEPLHCRTQAAPNAA